MEDTIGEREFIGRTRVEDVGILAEKILSVCSEYEKPIHQLNPEIREGLKVKIIEILDLSE